MPINTFLKSIRRKPDTNRTTNNGAASGATLPIRLSGTSPNALESVNRDPKDAPITDVQDQGRYGNDWLYPDWPRGRFDVGTVNGDRLQDIANSHLSEGPNPGRVPRQWNNRIQGKVGRGITGNPDGDNNPYIVLTGDAAGGLGDMMYIPHTPVPRILTTARTYLRTVDDAAQVPGVFLSDPTRH